MSLEEKRRLRTEFMNWLYNETDGDETTPVDVSEFASTHDVSADTLRTTIQYLEGEGMVEPLWTLGPALPDVSISHSGVREVEQALSAPDQPTEHFAPINVVNIHGNVVASPIQQAGAGAVQSVTLTADEKQQWLTLVEALRRDLSALGLDAEAEEQTMADLRVVDAELSRSEPRAGVVREILKSLRTVVEGAAGGTVASGLLALPWPS